MSLLGLPPMTTINKHSFKSYVFCFLIFSSVNVVINSKTKREFKKISFDSSVIKMIAGIAVLNSLLFSVHQEWKRTLTHSNASISNTLKVPRQEIASSVFREHLNRCYANAPLTQRIKIKLIFCQAGSALANNLLWCSWHLKNNSNPKKGTANDSNYIILYKWYEKKYW